MGPLCRDLSEMDSQRTALSVYLGATNLDDFDCDMSDGLQRPSTWPLLDRTLRAFTVGGRVLSIRSHQVLKECEIGKSININTRRHGSPGGAGLPACATSISDIVIQTGPQFR